MGSGKGQAKRVRSTTKKVASLIPDADIHVREGHNVLLVGPHGTGKTESLLQVARENDLSLKYFSAATLDPYTDLVGVPVPSYPDGDESNDPVLKMARDKTLMDAEIIFFDEMNRAHPKVMNAILEIIQFGTLNGEELPNLRACWAAINPGDEDYKVEDVDPALFDRFDAFYQIDAKPSAAYMTEVAGLPDRVSKALVGWWNKLDYEQDPELYVSPRRLVKIGQLHMAGIPARNAFMPNTKLNETCKSLQDALNDATKDADDIAKDLAAQRDKYAKLGYTDIEPLESSEFEANKKWVKANLTRLAVHNKINPNDQNILPQLTNLLRDKKQIPNSQLVDYAEVIASLERKDIEAAFTFADSNESNTRKTSFVADLKARYPNLDRWPEGEQFIEDLKGALNTRQHDFRQWSSSNRPNSPHHNQDEDFFRKLPGHPDNAPKKKITDSSGKEIEVPAVNMFWRGISRPEGLTETEKEDIKKLYESVSDDKKANDTNNILKQLTK